MDVLFSEPLVLIPAVVILGLVIGSFLNVVVYRLPIMMERQWKSECCDFLEINNSDGEQKPFNLVVPNSTCPKCNHKIKPWENIPILSYLALGGKCSNCKTTISKRYPLVEAATGVVSGIVAWQLGFQTGLLPALIFTWCLVTLTLIDADRKLLPDNITLPLLWLGLIVNSQGIFTDLTSALYGAAAGYLILWSVYWLFKILRGKEGMGFGDFKLLAALGAWCGWQLLPIIIIFSAGVGAILGTLFLVINGKDKNETIPFGPYLAIAGWIAFLWGDTIVHTYTTFLIEQ
jgi:leader peptidase (prepilin peptidase)/N-methyltransferase